MKKENVQFLAKLTALLGPEAVLASDADMTRYVADWRGNFPGIACGVALPSSVEQTAAVVALCAEHRVHIVPQGGNTGLVGGSVPDSTGTELVLSLTRMNRIRNVDPLCNAITVEAGCILQNVQEEAARHNRLFPLSLGARGTATIGGNLSTNAGGEQVLQYGNMRDLALGLEVVLADGRIWSSLSPLRKDNTGYDLKHLFIGAEGTLGVITAATLKLFPRPAQEYTAWLGIADPHAAVAILARLRELMGDRVTAFELMGRDILDLVLKQFPDTRSPISPIPPWAILTDITETACGLDLRELLEQALETLMSEGLILDAVLAASTQQAQSLWYLRDCIPESQRREGPSIKHDLSVPISCIPQFIERTAAALESAVPGIRIMCFGHVGDGNLHYNQSQPLDAGTDPDLFKAKAELIHDIVYEMTAALGGSISAEHGIGRLKQDALLKYKDPISLELMRHIKFTLDPHRLFNPGRLLPAGSNN